MANYELREAHHDRDLAHPSPLSPRSANPCSANCILHSSFFIPQSAIADHQSFHPAGILPVLLCRSGAFGAHFGANLVSPLSGLADSIGIAFPRLTPGGSVPPATPRLLGGWYDPLLRGFWPPLPPAAPRLMAVAIVRCFAAAFRCYRAPLRAWRCPCRMIPAA